MANAKPSGPGRQAAGNFVKEPEQNFPGLTAIVTRADGNVVERKVMTNGNVQETAVFSGDYVGKNRVKDAPQPITEDTWKKKLAEFLKGAE